MNRKDNSPESGQVLVILALAITGLLAFTALAVDGGLIFADRRAAQNAADAAVLAGGYRTANSLEDYQMGINLNYSNWDCSNSGMLQAINLGEVEAMQQADLNGYPITSTTHLVSTIDVTCEEGEDLGSYVDKYIEVISEITSRSNTAFVHFATGGELWQTVTAVSRVRPRTPLAFGYAIYAHRESCTAQEGGVEGSGNIEITIHGNGIMSDACFDANGGVEIVVDGCSGNYPIHYGTSDDSSGSYSVCPSPTGPSNPLPEWALTFPNVDCSNLSNLSSNGDGTINPGIYNGIMVTGNEELVMNPGLYCFTGDFTITGGTVLGNGVTIYLMSGADFSTVGNAEVKLTAPNFSADDEDGIVGVLIYMDSSYDGEISLLGDTESIYVGTVYAAHPDSEIEIGGAGDASSGGCAGSDTGYFTQLIAGRVWLHGNSDLDICFNKDLAFSMPSRLTLEK